jgi:hypothetical protein
MLMGKHPEDLIHRDAGALKAGFPEGHLWIN